MVWNIMAAVLGGPSASQEYNDNKICYIFLVIVH